MGYIEELSDVYRGHDNLIDFQLDACTYPAFYRYWTNELFERLMRIFVWEDTYELENGIIVGIDP